MKNIQTYILRTFLTLSVALIPASAQAALTVGSTSLTSDGAIAVNGVANTADSVYLHANGGTSETIRLHSDQGTGVDSINLLSDAGGVTLQSNLATADGINLTATSGGLDLDAGLGITIDSTTFLSFDVTSATSASNISVAVDADAEDLTISTTGSAGDIFITSADDLTLTGSPVAISSTGNITANTNISLTNGAIVYNDNHTTNITDCTVDGDETVNLSTGNYFIIYGSETENCDISFSNGTQGGLYIIKWAWLGAYDFIVSRFSFQLPRTSVQQVCEADGSTLDDSGDEATMLIIMRNTVDPDFVSCTVNVVQD